MKKIKLFAPLSILAMTLVACGGGSGDKTPEWAQKLAEEGYAYSETMPTDEAIKTALGLDYFAFPPLANVSGFAYIYNEASSSTGAAQNFNIIIEGDYLADLEDLLGDFGFEVHYNASDAYYWSIDSEREALYEIDFAGLESLEPSEDQSSGDDDIDWDSIDWDELDLARQNRAEEDPEPVVNYTSVTIYSVEDLWTQNATTDIDWNSTTEAFFNSYGFELPFMQFGDAYFWDDSAFAWFGCVTMSDYYWIDLSAQYEAILGAEGSGFEYVEPSGEYEGYYTTSDEFGNAIAVYVGWDDYGNSLTVYLYHVQQHEGTAEDPLNVADALAIIDANYSEDILETDDEYYVTGIVTGNIKTGSSGDYYFEMADTANSDVTLTIYYAKPNGFALPTVGETVTVAGKLAYYESSNLCEVKSGRMIDGTALEPTKVIVSKTNIKLAAEGTTTITASLDYEPEDPTFTAEYEAEWLTVNINGREIEFVVSATAEIGASVEVTIKSGELEPAVVKVTVVDPSDVPSDPVPAAMAKGTSAYDVTVNGAQGIKVGTSKVAGTMTITVGKGAESVSFYVGSWKGTSNVSLSITGATASPASVTLTSCDAFTGSESAFTVANVETYLVTIELSNITADTVLTLSASKRFIVWGATYIA